MNKELDCFIALGSVFLMRNKHYRDNDVELLNLKTHQKGKPQEFADTIIKGLETLGILKELFNFMLSHNSDEESYALLMYSKRTKQYFEIPINKDEYETLKEVLPNEQSDSN